MRTSPTISVTSIGSLIVAQGIPDLTANAATPYANSTGAMVDIGTGTGTQGRGAVLLFNGGVSTGSVQASAEL
jgi:hypothetical protein